MTVYNSFTYIYMNVYDSHAYRDIPQNPYSFKFNQDQEQ